MWNWQRADWPSFSYQPSLLAVHERQFLQKAGEHVGLLRYLSKEEQFSLKVDCLSEEALQTSQIEGEVLDRESIRASISRQLGLEVADRYVPPRERGVSAMMVDLYQHYDQSLDHATLWRWHRLLMEHSTSVENIGAYRQHKEAMQIVTGGHRERIHFEAPPSQNVPEEMDAFLCWFKRCGAHGETPLPTLIHAGIAHLYFVSIHPFEDGNGRLARAVSEMSLSQYLGRPSLVALADAMSRSRKEYYAALDRNNTQNEITDWLLYFSKTGLKALERTHQRIDFIFKKAKFYERFQEAFNARQKKVISRLFRVGFEGFQGGLNAEKYISITGAPRTTVTRDLRDLVSKEALLRTGERKYTRYFLNLDSVS